MRRKVVLGWTLLVVVLTLVDRRKDLFSPDGLFNVVINVLTNGVVWYLVASVVTIVLAGLFRRLKK